MALSCANFSPEQIFPNLHTYISYQDISSNIFIFPFHFIVGLLSTHFEFVVYFQTEFHLPKSIDSTVINIKPKYNRIFRMEAVLLLYIL
jgi:hypothetical protein